MPHHPPEGAPKKPAIFSRAFVLRLLLYGTIVSSLHLLFLWVAFGTRADGAGKFLLFPWLYFRDPLVNHIVVPLLNLWNLNSYRYITWFDLSGTLANSALWGFSIAFFLLPGSESHKEKEP